MALDLKLKINTANNCKNVVIQDTTGVYNSKSNPGGWGGFNINGNRQKFNLSIFFQIPILSKPDESNTPAVVRLLYYVPYDLISFPSEDTYRGFKISFTMQQLLNNSDLANSSESLEKIAGEYVNFMANKTVFPDGLFDVIVTVSDTNGKLSRSVVKSFKNICSAEKNVNKVLGSVNLNCEDCDDTDIEKALLAKSLLKAIKSI